MHTYVHTYDTCIHTCIHTYMHTYRENRNAEASADLKMLEKIEPHKVVKVQHVNRNKLAQKLLKNLETVHGNMAGPSAKTVVKKDLTVLGNVH
jgi:hypothetical protein